MRLYISADIEGISGVVNQCHVSAEGQDYFRARTLMTNEVNAAIEGAIEAGVKEVVVNDSHGPMTNILIENLHPAASLITGTPKRLGMMEGIQSDFDSVMFIGYHARMNQPGVLSHSYHGRVITNISINGMEVGEFAFNAFLAGHYHVPVMLVSGDNILAEEVKAVNDQIETVVVKYAQSRYAARSIQPCIVHGRIKDAVKQIIQREDLLKPCRIEGPVSLEVTFIHSGMAEVASIMPGTEMTAPNKVLYQAKDIQEAYLARAAMTYMAGSIL
ncbi:M55 family metallopeptidase [Geosporobacter ferrireducens]|uniref:Peptidase M55 n=1 Tax=Geosporobacter ferrireducens TaxID=1424294 RepID=A0A1D8GMK9_9FIRM|nr:M55 family metallopeptidase [Geosporobacter ferrireducens]AOT72163.1 peptidase M55 [Geosporobacter ferrireducens]MTI56052.1 peptidase M55 [Geosporobacter ferrireducens]